MQLMPVLHLIRSHCASLSASSATAAAATASVDDRRYTIDMLLSVERCLEARGVSAMPQLMGHENVGPGRW